MSQWKIHAQQVSELLQFGRCDEEKVLESLQALNALVYPIEALKFKDIEGLVKCIVKNSSRLNGELKIQVAQLIYSLLTYQKASIQSDILGNLLHEFISSLGSTHPPNELLYVSATILQLGVPYEKHGSLLEANGSLFKIALTSVYPIPTQRAGLHFMTTISEKLEFPRDQLLVVLDALLQSMSPGIADLREPNDALLLNKLLLSKLRLLHSLLPRLSPLPSLPILLSSLKATMATGLPGQSKMSMASIQPPLSLPVSATQFSKPIHSVAGPQEKKGQQKGRRSKGRARSSSSSSTDSHRQSSDSESSSSSSTSELSASSQSSWNEPAAELRGKGRTWRQGKKRVSSSESDISDSDSGSTKIRTVYCKIRHLAHSSLATVFQLLDRHTSFSYWLSFLPDGPRPPNSPPSLLTCILKDSSPKCRGAAVSVLCAMLEGSKSYLAAADDKLRPTQPFTPYSATLGGVVRELHQSLLLALTAEPHFTTLTQIIKALSLLVANAPYHQLSEGYISKVTTALGRLSSHRDVNVQVACLTCYGAIISIFPRHREVECWLQSPDHPAGTPWLFQHCISILQIQTSSVIQTESLQVLAALAKFYFPQIGHCWQQLKDFYLSHLMSLPHRVQHHVLKMLEEMCRALSSSQSAEMAVFWEQLLGGPLIPLLQNYYEDSTLSAQACDILATMSSHSMATIKAPFRMLALSLPLGLSKDENAPAPVVASAVRTLGMFVLFDSLCEDDNFFLDCQFAVTHCLNSTPMAVRVQASWALANLIDAMPSHSRPLPLPLILSLCEAVHRTLQDGDKVKCNGVRAAGNLLKQLPEDALGSCADVVKNFSILLAKCVNSGSMKSRWNSCYACHNAFSNTLFTSKFPLIISKLLSSLCSAVQNSKNFKVRSNAAMALSSAAMKGVISRDQLSEVWAGVLQALENSEQQVDFSEFKHAATLKRQLCIAICHLLVVPTLDGMSSLPTQELQDSSSRYISQFLSQALILDGKEDFETQGLIEKARLRLEQVVEQNSSVAASLRTLCDVFRKSFEEKSVT